jgi:hypothetical protein
MTNICKQRSNKCISCLRSIACYDGLNYLATAIIALYWSKHSTDNKSPWKGETGPTHKTNATDSELDQECERPTLRIVYRDEGKTRAPAAITGSRVVESTIWKFADKHANKTWISIMLSYVTGGKQNLSTS